MDLIGIIMVLVGGLIYFGSKIAYKRNEKKFLDYKEEESKSETEFLALLNNGAIVTQVIGSIMVITGAIFIIFL